MKPKKAKLPKLLAKHADARVYLAPWAELLEVVRAEGGCDALIVDAPYSSRTHRGHDNGVTNVARADNFTRTNAGAGGSRAWNARYARDGARRRSLNYASWSPAEVRAFVAAWEPLTRGWFVTLTDHVLARVWASALGRRGRYVFSPIACVESGGRVRMSGDGPSQWSCWAVVARPRGKPWSAWGALDGAYVVPRGFAERGAKRRDRVVGAKPFWLMSRLVEDYTRPGDLVVDPCCGGGTTLRAAQCSGRRAIGGDVDPLTADKAADKISGWVQPPLWAWGGGEAVLEAAS